MSNSTVEINASPSAFFCCSIIELNPPMVSRSSPFMEPLRSKIKTIPVKFFLICLSSSKKISPLRARCRGIRQGFEQARTLAHYTRIWLLGFVPYSHSIAIFFCGVVAWKATFLCSYAPIRLWSKANSASLISYTL